MTLHVHADIPARRSGRARRARSGVALVGAALVALAPTPGGAADAPRLQSLLRRASLVVAGEVAGVQEYGAGRVAVATLRPDKVLKGEPDPATGGTLAVVEMRDLPTPPLFEAGSRGIAFLNPARKSTYLKNTLPEARYFSPLDRPPGWLVAGSQADLDQMTVILAKVIDASRKPERDLAKRQATARTLTFDLVAARHPLLVEAGAAGIGDIADLHTTLTKDEEARLIAAIGRTDLPPRVRIALIRAVAAAGLTQIVPYLQGLSPPEVQATAWEAVATLGQPVQREEMERQLASTDPRVRALAVRETLRREGVGAAETARPLALRDPEPSVRVAAIDALGGTKSPQALPVLEQAFLDDNVEIRQAAGRAIHEIGGRAAMDAYARLAYQGSPDAQRYAVALLIFMEGVPRDDPVLQRLAKEHPDEKVRELITEGLPAHHH